MADMMTTKEVAAYLRIKERRVYELVHDRAIPFARVTGKLLFPKHLVDLWTLQGTEGPLHARPPAPPPVIAGSHDPLLDWAARESGSDLALLVCGSSGGLERLANGAAMAAGLHLRDAATGEYNVPVLRNTVGGMDVAAIRWARRAQGIVVAAGNPLGIRGVGDLARPGVRLVFRQDGSGSAVLLAQLLAAEGIDPSGLTPIEAASRSETELGFAILEGKADAGLAIEAVARQLRLGFVPLAAEFYDLAVRRRAYFDPPFQRLLAFARTPAFATRAGELGGYDVSELGAVVFNGG